MMSDSGLVTITGGKWTTYRRMAIDAVDAAIRAGGLAHVPSATAVLELPRLARAGAAAPRTVHLWF